MASLALSPVEAVHPPDALAVALAVHPPVAALAVALECLGRLLGRLLAQPRAPVLALDLDCVSSSSSSSFSPLVEVVRHCLLQAVALH